MTILRYLDVCLVLATAPFVLVAGLPLMGYLVGAAAWLLTRLGATALHTRALRLSDPKLRAGLLVGTMMGRVWIVALAVLLARYAGGRDDGIMAAVLVLGAFTVYLALSVAFRDGMLEGRPSTS
ncbi:MAG: hypothetical protein ACHQE6_01945 [Solirubrobacterales bacterium]